MSAPSSTAVIALTGNTLTATQVAAGHSMSTFAKAKQHVVTMLSDIRRSRQAAQSAFPFVRGN